jgi:hypothetical protein
LGVLAVMVEDLLENAVILLEDLDMLEQHQVVEAVVVEDQAEDLDTVESLDKVELVELVDMEESLSIQKHNSAITLFLLDKPIQFMLLYK